VSRTSQQDEQGFLRRWSRRKQESLDERDEDASATAPVEAAPPPTDEDMPPIDSLTEESDFTGFLSPGVSEELRKLALRKLFHGAAFNLRDGLDDYDQDFTSFTKLGDVVTADLRYRLEQEARRLAESEPRREAGEGDETEPRPLPEEAATADIGDGERSESGDAEEEKA
jgi:hypothetical protein